MPATVRPASHPARRYVPGVVPASNPESLFEVACPKEHERAKWMIRSSIKDFTSSEPIYASGNGFVTSVINAYSYHNHLKLRPEDFWFGILTQLSFHINANSEELRSFFVAHDGKKHLVIYSGGTIHTADFAGIALQMTELMQDNVVDPELKDWIMPDFTTTTHDDRVTAAVLMMGALQKYFTYEFRLRCGIPSVTLLGEKEDWVKIRQRVELLPRLGKEPKLFAKLLGVILDYFIKTFDNPTGKDVVQFWSKVAHKSSGSGVQHLSGWITAFCFWDEEGKCLYNSTSDKGNSRWDPQDVAVKIDGVKFHRVEMSKIPQGFSSVPVKVDDNGTVYWTRMTAGSVGIRVWSSGEPVDESSLHDSTSSSRVEENVGLDSIQPASGWFMYEDKSPEMEVGEGETSNLDLPEEEKTKPEPKPGPKRSKAVESITKIAKKLIPTKS